MILPHLRPGVATLANSHTAAGGAKENVTIAVDAAQFTFLWRPLGAIRGSRAIKSTELTG
jgi:hypothetical protein